MGGVVVRRADVHRLVGGERVVDGRRDGRIYSDGRCWWVRWYGGMHEILTARLARRLTVAS